MAYRSLGSLLSSALTLLVGGSLAARLPGRSDNSTADCTGVLALSPRCSSNQAAYARDIFYVGGRYYEDSSGNRTTDQLYVEKLTPTAVTQPKPVVFFHGGGTSGVSWLNTPDNRKGFGSSFRNFYSLLSRARYDVAQLFESLLGPSHECVAHQGRVNEHHVGLKGWFLVE